MQPAKPGYKTTEFWLSLVAMVVGFLAADGNLDPSSVTAKLVGIAGVVLAALGYSVSRGMTKSQL